MAGRNRNRWRAGLIAAGLGAAALTLLGGCRYRGFSHYRYSYGHDAVRCDRGWGSHSFGGHHRGSHVGGWGHRRH